MSNRSAHSRGFCCLIKTTLNLKQVAQGHNHGRILEALRLRVNDRDFCDVVRLAAGVRLSARGHTPRGQTVCPVLDLDRKNRMRDIWRFLPSGARSARHRHTFTP